MAPVPHAEGGKDRVVGKEVVWHESFIGPLCWVSPSGGVTDSLETQSTYGKGPGGQMHHWKRVFVGARYLNWGPSDYACRQPTG